MAPTGPHPSSHRVGLIRRTLRRRWRPILAVWLVGTVALAMVAYLGNRPVYRASSFLRVDPLAPDLYGMRTTSDQLDPFLQTQVQLITSPNVLTAAGTNPKAAVLPRIQTAGDVVIELRKAISVSVIPGTYLIEVAMSSPSAYESATLVNAVVDAFIEANVEWSDGMARTQIKNLETYLGDLRNQSDELERRWKDLVAAGHADAEVLTRQEQADGTRKAETKSARRGAITLEQYRQIQQMLFETNIELALAEAWASAAKADAMNPAKNPESRVDQARLDQQVERRFRRDPEVVELAARLAEANDKLQKILQASKDPFDPAVKVASANLSAVQSRYNEVFEAKTPILREEILAENDAEREWRDAEAKVRALRVKQATLKGEFDKLEVNNRRGAADEVEIALVVDQREGLKSMQNKVNLRLEQLKFEAKGEARVRPVNTALPPGRPIRDLRLSSMAYAPWMMLPIAFGLFLGVEWLSGPPAGAAKEGPPAEV